MKDKKAKTLGVGFVKGVSFNKPAEGYKKFKSWKLGYKAGRRGDPPSKCPYQLTDELRTLLIKRDRWLRGYEDAVFREHKKKRRE